MCLQPLLFMDGDLLCLTGEYQLIIFMVHFLRISSQNFLRISDTSKCPQWCKQTLTRASQIHVILLCALAPQFSLVTPWYSQLPLGWIPPPAKILEITEPQPMMVQDMTIQDINNSDSMGHQDLEDENVPAHSTEGYNFSLNTASICFHHSRNETQEDLAADANKDSLGLCC